MDKVIIFGTYHFLGFSLCEKLLEEGIEVCGYRFDDNKNEEFLEEKKLLIGRNANFEEREYGNFKKEKLIDESLKSEKVIVISFYDLYFALKGSIFHTLNKVIEYIKMAENYYSNFKLICLFPINYLNDFPTKLKDSIDLIKKKNITVQSIYLPTIFGPWQSSTFLFQQFLLKEYQKAVPKLDIRESTDDAIYITDVIETIFQLMHSADSADLLIQSSNGKQWIKGAEHFKWEGAVNHQHSIEVKLIEENIKLINLKDNTSIEDGIEQQKRHLARLL